MIIPKGSGVARDRAVRLSVVVGPIPSLMLMLSECTKSYVAFWNAKTIHSAHVSSRPRDLSHLQDCLWNSSPSSANSFRAIAHWRRSRASTRAAACSGPFRCPSSTRRSIGITRRTGGAFSRGTTNVGNISGGQFSVPNHLTRAHDSPSIDTPLRSRPAPLTPSHAVPPPTTRTSIARSSSCPAR